MDDKQHDKQKINKASTSFRMSLPNKIVNQNVEENVKLKKRISVVMQSLVQTASNDLS